MATPISMDDLFEKFKALDSGSLIVDVRTPEEFSEGHVPGSKNFPVDQIANHTSELKKYKKLFIYCRSGGRVGVATTILEAAGIKEIQSVLMGGFPNWAARGYEIEFD